MFFNNIETAKQPNQLTFPFSRLNNKDIKTYL